MISRRIFLKNGGLALVSLGFAPSFLARTAAAADAAAQGADHDLPARRGRRPEHDRAVRRARLLRGAAEHRDRAARDGGRTRRSISTASSACTRGSRRSSRSTTRASSRSSTPAARRTARARTSTRRTTWRRATPGVKSTPDGWLNRYLHAREHAGGDAVPRRRAGAAAAARAAGPRAGAGDRPDRPVRHPRRPEHARWCRRRSRAEYAAAADRRAATRTGREAFDAIKHAEDADPAQLHARERRRVPARRRSARRCSRSRS